MIFQNGPVASTCFPLRATPCCVGGCFGSPEDKLAIPCTENLLILNPMFLSGDPNSKSSSCTQVSVNQRAPSNVKLSDATVAQGSNDQKTFRLALNEFSNRAVILSQQRDSCETMCSRNGIRSVDWSPRGVDRLGRSVVSVVTYEGRAAILVTKGTDAWMELIDLSAAWKGYYIIHGRVPRNYSFSCDQRPMLDPENTQQIAPTPLVCKTVSEYVDAVEDVNFLSVCWSHLPRCPQLPSLNLKTDADSPGTNPNPSVIGTNPNPKAANPVLLLTTLMKSGTVAFWGIRLPLINVSSASLVLVDYTYAVSRKTDSTSGPSQPVFMKLCDLDSTHCLSVLVFSDGSVSGLVYDIHFSTEGSLQLKFSHKLRLCNQPISHTPVISCAWSMSDGLLCMGYGRFLLVVEIKALKFANGLLRHPAGSLLPTFQIVRQYLTKPDDPVIGCITGVHIGKPRVYITTLDGYLAIMTLDESPSVSKKWAIIWSSATYDNADQVQWEFHGLSVSCNGVYMCFVERPVNYLDNTRQLHLAVYTPRVRFLSYWPNSLLLELIFDPKLTVNRKFDALQQLSQRWYGTDELAVEIRNECLQAMEFIDQADASSRKLPSSWLGKPPELLQVYRLLLQLLTKENIRTVKEQASSWLTDLDNLLRDRHFDHCLQLFLQSSVQRQAVDCLLVIRIANTLLNWYASVDQSDKSLPAGPVRCILPTLRHTAETARNLARQLYLYRFRRPATDFPPEEAVCPVCSERVVPDLSHSICANGHSIDRCMQTLDPCIDVNFRSCERCERVAVAVSLQDRLSVWRISVVHPLCIYCDLPLSWRNL